MSHLEERKETNCLNCNAEVSGKYCSVCGQENIEPAESAWHLITHFFNDITHFDGKFFSSLKYLILKPGFLSGEYKLGRRASYLNPIRMYVFTSFIFFFIFFSIFHFDDINVLGKSELNGKSAEAITKMDSATFKIFAKTVDSTREMSKADAINYLDSAFKVKEGISEFESEEQYDSLLQSGARKDGWLERKINYRQIAIDKKYNKDGKRFSQDIVNTFMHGIPQMLFISLPLFALFLKLLYRRSKDFYYVSHAIFTLHLYIFIFIVLLANIGLSELAERTEWGIFSYLIAALNIWIFIYEYKAMRNFYGQRRKKTIIKFILLNMYLFFIMLLIFILFLIFSFLKV